MCLFFDGLLLNWGFCVGYLGYFRPLQAQLCNISSIFDMGSFAFVIQKMGL